MIACPVCEHAQAHGAECDVCGARLPRAAAAPSGAPPVDGLEPTRHEAAHAAAEPLSGLEPTRHAPAAGAPGEPLEIEATRAARVDAEILPVDWVERAAAELPGDAPTAIPALVACRYCRTMAMPGERLCGRCGMRLPSYAPGAADGPPASRLCSCGTPVRSEGACPSCGARR